MIEIIPNWHPLLVHFTIALLFTATVFFVVGRVFAAKPWSAKLMAAARWNLCFGAFVTVATVAAGIHAYNTVTHDAPSHLAMTDHRNWALPTAAAFVALALWSLWQRRQGIQPSPLFLAAAVVATAALGVTGFKGGEVVYRHGLGVMALPQAETEGGGHHHDLGEEDEPEAMHKDHHEQATPTLPDPLPGSAAATLDAFHRALQEGRGEDALAFLAEDVVIFESGGMEASRAAYGGHHLGADMAFLKYMTEAQLSRKVRETDGLVIVTSRNRTSGKYRDRAINLLGTETAVLERHDDRWRIVHLHWSSHENAEQ